MRESNPHGYEKCKKPNNHAGSHVRTLRNPESGSRAQNDGERVIPAEQIRNLERVDSAVPDKEAQEPQATAEEVLDYRRAVISQPPPPGERICFQCYDGKEPQTDHDGVLLHAECGRFWFRAGAGPVRIPPIPSVPTVPGRTLGAIGYCAV